MCTPYTVLVHILIQYTGFNIFKYSITGQHQNSAYLCSKQMNAQRGKYIFTVARREEPFYDFAPVNGCLCLDCAGLGS